MELLDVLEQLPRDDLRRSLWLHLRIPMNEEADANLRYKLGRSFRLSCQRSRGLADQLTQKMILDLPVGDDSAEVLSAQAVFLGRQQGLEELTLNGSVGSELLPVANVELFFIKTLLQSRVTCGRLHSLAIHAASAAACSGAMGEAVQLCCPSLRELAVHVPDPGHKCFKPLHGCPDLQKITIVSKQSRHIASFTHQPDRLSGAVVQTLADLPGLRSLSLSGCFHVADVACLSRLKGLRELRASSLLVDLRDNAEALMLGGALGALAQLTALDVPGPTSNSSAVLDAVVSQVGGLTNLVDVTFGEAYGPGQEVLPGAFDALCRLTALTRLSCPPFSPSMPSTAGQLPRLRHLNIMGGALLPSNLVATLRPLLPLPELREFECSVICTEDRGAAVPVNGGTHTPAVAARQAAHLLGKAPRLESVCLDITTDHLWHAGSVSATEASGIICALLTPLGDVLKKLNLTRLPSGTLQAMWPVLCMASRLQSLCLDECPMSESMLLLLVGHNLATLRQVFVMHCDGLSAASCVALAGARAQPLCVDWWPDLDAGQRQQFLAAARADVILDD